VIRRCSAALLLFCSLTFAAEKTPPLPKDLPPYGEMKIYTPPPVQQSKLANGLTLWLVPEPGFPKVVFAAEIRGGSAQDATNRPGLSDFLATVLDQGTKTRKSREIAEQMQSAGGDLHASASADSISLSASVLSSRKEVGLAVFADVLQNATFPENEVEVARGNLSNNLKLQESDPGFLAERALARAIYGNHPYAVVSATESSLKAITAGDLRQEYARRFRPDQTIIVAVGDFEGAAMTAALTQAFSGWSNGSAAAVQPAPDAPTSFTHSIFTVERPNSVQTTLVWASPGPRRADPDYDTARVAEAIFGGMFGSRLINNIREDKGYTYSPFSFLSTKLKSGVIQTQADVRNGVTGASFNEVMYEMNRMATTGPTEKELNQSRRYIVGNRAVRLQTHGQLAGALAGLWVLDLSPDQLALESQRVLKVSADDVRRVGAKYFPASKATAVAVGEKQVMQDQLGAFAIPMTAAPVQQQ
jgi:predicted Zn-dependent peptidase